MPQAIKFIGIGPTNGDKVRRFIKLHRVGCTAVRVRGYERQYLGVHVQISFLDEELKGQLESGNNFMCFLLHFCIVISYLFMSTFSLDHMWY